MDTANIKGTKSIGTMLYTVPIDHHSGWVLGNGRDSGHANTVRVVKVDQVNRRHSQYAHSPHIVSHIRITWADGYLFSNRDVRYRNDVACVKTVGVNLASGRPIRRRRPLLIPRLRFGVNSVKFAPHIVRATNTDQYNNHRN